MPEKDSEEGFKLNRPPHRTKGRGLRIPLSERLRAARRIPQAVVKVTSFSRGLHQVTNHLSYISRKGKLPLEKDTGELLLGQDAQEDLASEWSMDFDNRKRSRDTANIVFSMPPGSDIEALRKAVRIVGGKAFGDHEWVFGLHEDRNHPHAHMMVKMRDREGEKKLRLRKADLYKLRETFAEAARDQGVQLAASPRAARGVVRSGLRLSEYHLREKGIAPKNKKAEAKSEISTQIAIEQEKAWNRKMTMRQQRESEAYLSEANLLRLVADKRAPEEQEKIKSIARELEEFAKSIAPPHSRGQELGTTSKEDTSTQNRLTSNQKRKTRTELER